MSLERINVFKGYHLDNCKLVLRRMNCPDYTISSLHPELVNHGMTIEKWQSIMQSVIMNKK